MLALRPTDGSDPLVKIGGAPDPPTAPDESLIEVEAFSINRGETFLLERPRPGWRPSLDDAAGPFDVAFESVGGISLPQALKLLVKGGRLIWLGQASRTPSRLDFFDFFAQTGATIRHFDHDDSSVPDSSDLATLVRLVANDRLHPEVGVVADWTQTALVLEDLRERRIRGNAVLRTDHDNHLINHPTGRCE